MKTFKEYTRDYKAEYKKHQSSPERIKYRAELVKYNRDKGTYGNGDGKDASHKNGKIVGFEDQSKNRGRAESSRLKGSKRKVDEAEYQGRKVELNNPFRTPKGPKKFSVYVKNEKGNVVKVNFGDPNMEIKRDDPARRKSFRARHNCSDPGPKWKARYWSCYQWRARAKVDN